MIFVGSGYATIWPHRPFERWRGGSKTFAVTWMAVAGRQLQCPHFEQVSRQLFGRLVAIPSGPCYLHTSQKQRVDFDRHCHTNSFNI